MKKLTLIIMMCLLLVGCDSTPKSSELFSMNTYITQKTYGLNGEAAIRQVENFIKEIEGKLSLYIADSDIDKINKNAGVSAVNVSDTTFDLIKIAKEYSAASKGSFDITIAPLTKLWGISGDSPTVPTVEQIDLATSLIDYDKIILSQQEKTIMLADRGMAIDLGGIAKGYICNGINDIYKKNKLDGAIASIGGNVLAYGEKPDGTEFILGVRDPNGGPNDTVGKFEISDCVVATSGAYERFFEQDGKKYHHILDTKTGYPVESDLLSVTVVSEDGGLADYLSTTLYIAGSKYVSEYIDHTDFGVIAIDKNNNIYISKSIKPQFTLTNTSYKIK